MAITSQYESQIIENYTNKISSTVDYYATTKTTFSIPFSWFLYLNKQSNPKAAVTKPIITKTSDSFVTIKPISTEPVIITTSESPTGKSRVPVKRKNSTRRNPPKTKPITTTTLNATATWSL